MTATQNKKSTNKTTRRVLGIDPGLASTGWGVIDTNGSRFVHLAHGVIETDAETPHEMRLLKIYNFINKIILDFCPTEAGMETLYFAKNASSALSVAEARGVVTLALAQCAVPLGEYTPLTIKQCVVGSAKAEKKHVQEYIKLLLGLDAVPKPDHAADALAAAITHVHHAPSGIKPL